MRQVATFRCPLLGLYGMTFAVLLAGILCASTWLLGSSCAGMLAGMSGGAPFCVWSAQDRSGAGRGRQVVVRLCSVLGLLGDMFELELLTRTALGGVVVYSLTQNMGAACLSTRRRA